MGVQDELLGNISNTVVLMWVAETLVDTSEGTPIYIVKTKARVANNIWFMPSNRSLLF